MQETNRHGRCPGRAVGAGARALRVHLPDDLLDLGVDDAERPLLAQLAGDLLAGHGAGAPAPALLQPLLAGRLGRPTGPTGSTAASSTGSGCSLRLASFITPPPFPTLAGARPSRARRPMLSPLRQFLHRSCLTVATRPPTFSMRRSACRTSRCARPSSPSISRRRGCSRAFRDQLGEQRGEAVLHVPELVLQPHEAPPDLLEGHALRHHPLDEVDAADHVDRVEPGRPGVLALAPHPAAAGQEPDLDVLPEGGLRQARPPRLEDPHHFTAGDASGPLSLEPADLALRNQEVH